MKIKQVSTTTKTFMTSAHCNACSRKQLVHCSRDCRQNHQSSKQSLKKLAIFRLNAKNNSANHYYNLSTMLQSVSYDYKGLQINDTLGKKPNYFAECLLDPGGTIMLYSNRYLQLKSLIAHVNHYQMYQSGWVYLIKLPSSKPSIWNIAFLHALNKRRTCAYMILPKLSTLSLDNLVTTTIFESPITFSTTIKKLVSSRLRKRTGRSTIPYMHLRIQKCNLVHVTLVKSII